MKVKITILNFIFSLITDFSPIWWSFALNMYFGWCLWIEASTSKASNKGGWRASLNLKQIYLLTRLTSGSKSLILSFLAFSLKKNWKSCLESTIWTWNEGKMSSFKFSIPLQLKDLANHSGKGEYRVENEYSVRDLKLKLNVSQIIPFF